MVCGCRTCGSKFAFRARGVELQAFQARRCWRQCLQVFCIHELRSVSCYPAPTQNRAAHTQMKFIVVAQDITKSPGFRIWPRRVHGVAAGAWSYSYRTSVKPLPEPSIGTWRLKSMTVNPPYSLSRREELRPAGSQSRASGHLPILILLRTSKQYPSSKFAWPFCLYLLDFG